MNDSTTLRVDCLSLVKVVASQSCTALTLVEVSIKCAAVLPMTWRSAPPSAVVEDVVLLGDMGDGSRVRISLAADDARVSWQERLVHARGLSRKERGSEARGHGSVPVEDRFQPAAEDPEVSKGQCDLNSQEDELVCPVARALVLQRWESSL